jgi:hypothetical protein
VAGILITIQEGGVQDELLFIFIYGFLGEV